MSSRTVAATRAGGIPACHLNFVFPSGGRGSSQRCRGAPLPRSEHALVQPGEEDDAGSVQPGGEMSGRRVYRQHQLCRRDEIQQFDQVFREVNFGILDTGSCEAESRARLERLADHSSPPAERLSQRVQA